MPIHSHCILFFIFLPDDWLRYLQSESYRYREVSEDTENELPVQEHRIKQEWGSDLCWKNVEKNRKTTIVKRRTNVSKNSYQFKCSCGRFYKQQKYLNYHKKWECGKPSRYQCSKCSFGTTSHSSLKKHIQRMHYK